VEYAGVLRGTAYLRADDVICLVSDDGFRSAICGSALEKKKLSTLLYQYMMNQVHEKGKELTPSNKLEGNRSQITSLSFAHPSAMFVIIAAQNCSRCRSSVELNSTALFSVLGPVSS
jgi:hypothetical protein